MNQLTTDIRAFCITTSFFLFSEFRVNELPETGLYFSAKRTAYWSDMTRRRDVHIFSQSLLKKGICQYFPQLLMSFFLFEFSSGTPVSTDRNRLFRFAHKSGMACAWVVAVVTSWECWNLSRSPLPVSVVQDLAPFVDLDLCQKNALFQTCRPLSSFLARKYKVHCKYPQYVCMYVCNVCL